MRKNRISPALFIQGMITLAAVIVLITGLTQIQKDYDDQDCQRIQTSILKAAVNCYSLEGFYPSNVDYLIEHYGIIVDKEHYNIFYQAQGSNMAPRIDVIRKG